MAKEKRSSKVPEYDNVYHVPYDRGRLVDKPYLAKITINKVVTDLGRYETAKKAAIAVDMFLIREGLPPKNVLTPLNKNNNEKDRNNSTITDK